MENKNKEIIKTSDEVNTQAGFSWNTVKNFFKSDKIKNQALLKRGGYSVILTIVVLVGLIVLNGIMGSLIKKYNLTVDMTTDQKNSISKDNIDYIKKLDADVEIIVCASSADSYKGEIADFLYYYGLVTFESSVDTQLEYFDQTVRLLEKYTAYNDRITVKYHDIQSSEFIAIQNQYTNEYFYPGDIVVMSKSSGNERMKHLTYSDIYSLYTDESSAYLYGYTLTTIQGNNVESTVTSAIDYVTNAEIKKVAFLSGHNKGGSLDAFKELYAINNYEITEIEDMVIGEISSDFDAVLIAAPTRDFTGEELDAIAAFLENNGRLGKGLLYFADAASPAVPNLNAFLKQWGILIEEGTLKETNSKYHIPSNPGAIYCGPMSIEGDNLTDPIKYFMITDYNVPMSVYKESIGEIVVNEIASTNNSVVVAPLGASSTWSDYTDEDKRSYSTVIQAKLTRYDNEIEDINKRELSSYVYAFSSVEFVQSVYATDSNYSDFYNQEMALVCTGRATHKNTDHIFKSKVITAENFYAKINEDDVKNIGYVYIAALPVIVIVAGIVVFIIRRKSV